MSAFRVLVVEDEGLVAMMLEDLLDDMGCEVAGSLASVAQAMAWLDGGGSWLERLVCPVAATPLPGR